MPLEALLDQAAAALLDGDLIALARLTPEIEAARIDPTDRASAERLQAYDARGQKAEIAPLGATPARRV